MSDAKLPSVSEVVLEWMTTTPLDDPDGDGGYDGYTYEAIADLANRCHAVVEADCRAVAERVREACARAAFMAVTPGDEEAANAIRALDLDALLGDGEGEG